MKNGFMIILVSSFVVGVLGGCGQQNDAALTPVESTQSNVESPVETQPVPAAEVIFGRYVQRETYRIRGNATRFEQGQRVFANATVNGVRVPGVLQMRMIDETGEIVAQIDREAKLIDGAVSSNFAIGDAVKRQPIPAGIYMVETRFNGELVDTSRVTILE